MTDDRMLRDAKGVKLRDAKGSSMPALVKAAIAFRHALRQHSGEPDADVHAMRAVLLSLREPDEAMLEAMSAAVWRTALDANDLGSEDVLRGWQAAIDQILATGEGR